MSVYISNVFFRYGKSNKIEFSEDEFRALHTQYPKIFILADKEKIKVNIDSDISINTSRRVEVVANLADIGTLPDTPPVSLAERAGWITLKKQKEILTEELANIDIKLPLWSEQSAILSAEISAIKAEMGVE